MAKFTPGALPTMILHHLADGSCRTIDELTSDLCLSRRQISDAATRLSYRKYLMRMQRGCYQLSEAGIAAAAAGEVITSGPTGPDTARVRNKVRDTFRDRAWRAMRMRRQFTAGDIVADAATDGDADPDNNIARYLRYLRMAGYVIELRKRQPGTRLTSNGFKRYALQIDSGPIAPAFRPKSGTLHDYNIGRDVPCADRP